jgi:hypothetical protein
MPRAGFEPAIPATKRPQTYALDCVATGIGNNNNNNNTLNNDNYNTRMRYSVLLYFCIALLRSTFRSVLPGLTELGGGQGNAWWRADELKKRRSLDRWHESLITVLVAATMHMSVTGYAALRWPPWSAWHGYIHPVPAGCLSDPSDPHLHLWTHFAVRGDRRLNTVEVYLDQPFSLFLPWRNPWNNFQVSGNPCIKKYIYNSRYVSVISKL